MAVKNKEDKMEWVTQNWVGVTAVIGGAVTLFSAVASLTSTKRDDSIAAWLKNVLGRFLSIK